MGYSVVIAKPTKACNADCSYCSAPIDDTGKWKFDDFKRIIDTIARYFTEEMDWIWHGGEPMLMGPDFYYECAEYVKDFPTTIKFAMQTNLLSYNHDRWYDLFHTTFKGRISSSFDPYKKFRTVKGNSDTYDRIFWKSLEAILEDGFHPLLIGVYDEGGAKNIFDIYKRAISYGKDTFSFRVNYAYPAGRAKNSGAMIRPKTYGQMLIDLYDRWLADMPAFAITPLDQMLSKVCGYQNGRCPWTKDCGGRFLTVDPDGSVWNCSEFSDLNDTKLMFGNVLTGEIAPTEEGGATKRVKPELWVPQMRSTVASRKMVERRFNVPLDCRSCRHYSECEGGCMRDAELFDRGLGGKFYYCQSWKMVFDHIKASVLSGGADAMIRRMKYSPEDAKHRLKGYEETRKEIIASIC
ncbi:MAG: radical SAM protein [Pseudomonadales bacterium]